MMKRGCSIVPVYLNNTPFTDDRATRKALDAAKTLFEWSIGFPRKVYIVPHGRNLETFLQKSPRKLTCLLCKRMMYRIAERIADLEGAEGIVTGEAVGEQASQTVTNLMVLNEASRKYPAHRPLLGFDKTETTELSRKIGTYEISTRKAKACNAAPNKPATGAKLTRLKDAENQLDIERMVEESIRALRIVTV
jgi:thiamine biosynthesis protein ThiI